MRRHRECSGDRVRGIVWKVVRSLAAASVVAVQSACVRTPAQPSEDPFTIFNGTLTPGFDLGVDDSLHVRDWIEVRDGELRMFYGGGNLWGAVFFVVGMVSEDKRVSLDFSLFRTLSLDLRTDAERTVVQVGVKDRWDRDDGSEKRKTLVVESEWKTFPIELSDLDTADLHEVYVPAEFVFEGALPCNVYCRRVKYVK